MSAGSAAAANKRTGAVFLSYASEDSAASGRIASALREAGIEVWFDQSELRGGDAWERQIQDRIHDCRLFMPVISASTERRDEGYFRREWGLAVDRTRDMAEKKTFLVPVVIDDTSQRAASVPDKFRHVQWSRLPEGAVPQAFIDRMVALLTTDGGAPAPAGAGPSQGEVAKAATRSPLWPALALGALLLGAGAGWWAWRHSGTERGAGPAVAAKVTDKSIAVLPFVDLSEKHDQEYFADGLAEEILDLLAKIPGLKVIGRTSSFQFKGKVGADLRRIGTALGAVYVVEGSVRKLGERLRVTVQLIDTRDGAHRWSETYDRGAADTLSLQREIATAVARQLQVSVSDYFGPGGTTRSAEAYDLYLRGIRDVDADDPESLQRSAAELSKATELDPAYVNAWVGLADAYDVLATTNLGPRAEYYRLGRQAVDRALALDPMNADAYAMRAFIRMNVWDWSGADDDIRKSQGIRRNSGAAEAAAKLAVARGDVREAERLLTGALALDPLDTYSLNELAYSVYPAMGRFEDSDRMYAKLRDINADTIYLNANQSWNAVETGDFERALQLAQAEKRPDGRETALAVVYSATHQPDKAGQALARLMQIPGVSEYNVATVYAYLGEKEPAFQYLEKAFDSHSPDLLGLKIEPMLASVRGDPRYRALLRRMGLPE